MRSDSLIANIRLASSQADAVAIADGLILCIGVESDLVGLVGPQTRLLDGHGARFLPGFVESHVHLFGGGVALLQLNVAAIEGQAALTTAIRAFDKAHPGDHLLQAYGANNTILGNVRPSRHDLDRILPDRPLSITATDLHCIWANTRALELAGILRGSEVGQGPEVVKGAEGLASGELREFAAMGLVLRHGLSGGHEALGLPGIEPGQVSAKDRTADKDALARAMAECARLGITRAVNMDGNFYQAEFLTEMEAEGRLPIRVSLPLVLTTAHGPQDTARALAMGIGSERLRFHRIKMFMDGVDDTWTAFVTDAYPDRPGFAGTPLFAAEAFNIIRIEADSLRLQIAVHAVGDGAVRRVLDGYATASAANGSRDSCHRIERIDTIHPDDLPRLAALGVAVSIQPGHPPGSAWLTLEPSISMMGRARWPLAFPWRKLRDQGVSLAFGTDWPVSPLDPLHAIQRALTRQPWSADMRRTSGLNLMNVCTPMVLRDAPPISPTQDAARLRSACRRTLCCLRGSLPPYRDQQPTGRRCGQRYVRAKTSMKRPPLHDDLQPRLNQYRPRLPRAAFARSWRNPCGGFAAIRLRGQGREPIRGCWLASARIRHIGAIGPEGAWILLPLTYAGVDIGAVARCDAPTGHAIMNVDDHAENAIVLFTGANAKQDWEAINKALTTAKSGETLMLQNETTEQAFTAELAAEKGLRVVYSAAPFDFTAVRAVLPPC